MKHDIIVPKPHFTFKPDNRRGGRIVEILDGVHKGEYGQIPYAKQHASFAQIEKLFIEFYKDQNCTVPCMHEGKKTVGLIHYVLLKQIGFYD